MVNLQRTKLADLGGVATECVWEKSQCVLSALQNALQGALPSMEVFQKAFHSKPGWRYSHELVKDAPKKVVERDVVVLRSVLQHDFQTLPHGCCGRGLCCHSLHG